MAAEHFGNWALYLGNKWDYVPGKPGPSCEW